MRSIKPLKRVGATASFIGLRGDYLTSFIMSCFLFLFVMLIIVAIPIDELIKVVICVCMVYISYHRYNDLKKKSKGDIYHTLKKSCRKKLIIRSKNNI